MLTWVLKVSSRIIPFLFRLVVKKSNEVPYVKIKKTMFK